MSHDPAKDFAQFLGTQVAALTYATNLFSRPLTDREETIGTVPPDCVFVSPLPGVPPQRFMKEVEEVRTSLLNVTIRHRKNSTGRSWGQSIINSMNGLTGKPANYLDAVPQAGDPAFDGQDDKGLFLYSVIVILQWSEVT